MSILEYVYYVAHCCCRDVKGHPGLNSMCRCASSVSWSFYSTARTARDNQSPAGSSWTLRISINKGNSPKIIWSCNRPCFSWVFEGLGFVKPNALHGLCTPLSPCIPSGLSRSHGSYREPEAKLQLATCSTMMRHVVLRECRCFFPQAVNSISASKDRKKKRRVKFMRTPSAQTPIFRSSDPKLAVPCFRLVLVFQDALRLMSSGDIPRNPPEPAGTLRTPLKADPSQSRCGQRPRFQLLGNKVDSFSGIYRYFTWWVLYLDVQRQVSRLQPYSFR